MVAADVVVAEGVVGLDDGLALLEVRFERALKQVAGVEQELAYVNSPYPLLDLRGETEERS